jgi:hypothetical protein
MSIGTGNGSGKKTLWLIVTIIVLLVLAIGSGFFTYFRFQELNGQTQIGSPIVPTGQTSVKGVTSTPPVDLAPLSVTQLYQYVIRKPPSLTDSLDGSHAGNWDIGPGCQFKQKAFHLITRPPLSQQNVFCFLRNEFVRDFAFQIQVQFGAITNPTETQGCGILFRLHLVQQDGYEFFMYVSSGLFNQFIYGASLSSHIHPKTPKELKSWENGVPHQVNVFNTLTVIAVHHQINLYINDQFKETVTDSTFQGGQIGLAGGSTYISPVSTNSFEVIYRNMKLWNLNQG